jgi:predicted ATPase
MPVEESNLIIIEEPETHLHPAAHGNLAERFVDSYLEDKNRSYLIETHSQNFVLRMRRLVAEGKMKPEQIAIYYVDFDYEQNISNLEDIVVHEDGSVEKWPEGVFGEAVIEARAIMNANINDLRNVD